MNYGMEKNLDERCKNSLQSVTQQTSEMEYAISELTQAIIYLNNGIQDLEIRLAGVSVNNEVKVCEDKIQSGRNLNAPIPNNIHSQSKQLVSMAEQLSRMNINLAL